MRATCLDWIYRLAKLDARVVFIGSDLKAGTLDEMRKELPRQFLMEGISEQNIVGMAAGMALEGKIVYINTIASFLTRRAFEQIAIDVCLHNLPVRLIGNGGGFVYAPLGPTHTTLEDIQIMRSLPNMTVVCPCDADEMERLMPQTVGHRGPIYIRLGRGGDEVVSKGPFTIGKSILLREGNPLIVTTGVMVQQALKMSGGVLHCHTVKPLDPTHILSHKGEIVVLEEGFGLHSAVSELLGPKRLGPENVFPEGYGVQEDHWCWLK